MLGAIIHHYVMIGTAQITAITRDITILPAATPPVARPNTADKHHRLMHENNSESNMIVPNTMATEIVKINTILNGVVTAKIRGIK
jgi:hypothetical protein